MPTDAPESDGTLAWDSTTMIVVEAHAGDLTGLGYTYGDVAVTRFVESKLADVGRDRLGPPQHPPSLGPRSGPPGRSRSRNV